MADETVEAQSQESAVTESPTGDTSGGTPESTTTQDAGTEASSGKSFFTYGEQSFKDADALKAHLDKESESARRERMNKSEYDERITAFNTERQKHLEAVKQHEATTKQWEAKQSQYNQLDEVLRQRPDVAQYINQLLGQAPSAEVVSQRNNSEIEEAIAKVEAKYAPILEAHQAAEDEKATESQLQEIFQDTSILPNGTNEQRVRETLDAIETSSNPAKELAITLAKVFANDKPAAEQNGQGGRRRIQSNGSASPTNEPQIKKGMTNEEIQEAQLAALGYTT